ncbi:GGDEF domain-containing protein [Niveibacterium umoris]|uniref:Diguanylate cyclase (GGDEF)-like protein n=1 Tax=Niveibacterium umoris TaxID=1193620 RepID=A0A840BK73_9RHOO|nr:GGDEF domain-containing protein [Niveibacterium umoris]MBB4010947.1 diguanylate cyclase (GGDEF)-like protein [Niveibacterium umoris]
MRPRLFLDTRSRVLMTLICVITLALCAAAFWAGSGMIEIQRAGDQDEHLQHRLESLRSAILAGALADATLPATDDSVSKILAECLHLSADDAAQQRRLTKLGTLLDQQREPPAQPMPSDEAGVEEGVVPPPVDIGRSYVLLAAQAWIDAMQIELSARVDASRVRQDELLRWLIWSVAAAAIAALCFGLVLIRVMRRLTQQGHARISTLEARANRDPLTGLPNRRLLPDRLEQALLRAERRNRHAAVIVIDLDGFKPVNDTHGHAVGDVVLRRVSKRMKSALRSEDTVCRMGGDEFVVIIGEVEDPVLAVRRARDLVLRISRPILHEEKVLRVGASAGLALFPDDAEDGTELLELADQALYAAKHGGRGQVVTAREMQQGNTTFHLTPGDQLESA